MRRLIRILVWLLALPALFACLPAQDVAPAGDETAAAEALVTFFDLLQAGDYAEAAAHYGGSYEVLAGYNPNVDPEDVVTLWRNGCSINGLNCLKVRSHKTDGRTEVGEWLFNVEFSTREGDLFVLGPCCGATEAEQPSASTFPIRVALQEDGRYRVIDLPPYAP